jgi:hypothetical protein
MADDDSALESSTFGDTRFFSLLSELAERHSERAIAYGIQDAEENGFGEDPLASVRYASPDFGIDPWVYSLVRANECMRRLQGQIISEEPSNPDLRKAFLDLASYALLSLIFWEEDQENLSAFSADMGEDDE